MLCQGTMADLAATLNLKRAERWGYRLLLAGAIGVVHYLLARLSLSFITSPEGISVFWLPEGFLIGALALIRKKDWPLVIALVYGLGVVGEWETKAFSAQIWLLPAVNCLEGVFGAALLRRVAP